ncbi:MAG: DNA polymerase/3'-5' exonuclease PolX [Verrucomicrobia bacterium]|nr:MAG: DNA polymerase/3'-5' exonuclease PolX [Verrucomicrobiota bacterium]
MNKADIADILNEIGTLLELKGENPFKVRAYHNGARALETLDGDLGELIAEGRLGKVKGIGAALAQKIETLYETGRLPFYEELRASVPEGLLEMLEIPGMGAKKVRAIHEKLGITTIEELAEACAAGRVAELPGFGKKSEEKIAAGIRNREAYSKRHLWWSAYAVAGPIVEGLRKLPQVERAEYAGSLRRNLETVGDLDFIVASREPGPVMDWFVGLPGVIEVTGRGETKSSIRLEGGMQADLRVVPPEQFAFALHHFTGSKEHNVMMRQRALARGWSLSEWGLSVVEHGETGEGGAPPPPADIRDESGVFAALGLSYIPPELREGLNEIEAAEHDAIPELIRVEDLQGCFHNHTHASDGRNSLEEMAAAAAEHGWAYLGIADHSRAAFQANGLDEDRLAAQIEAIRRLNASGRFPVRLFAGLECDILADGRLDMDGDLLRELDYVVASVHNALGQPEEEMTRRLIRAIEHPCTTMLGHPTGRLLLAREPSRVDMARIIDAAAANGVVIELNANPRRLDMDWRWWSRAAEKGVLCSINPDAHATEQLDFVEAGVRVARKGWLTREHVLNTRSLAEIEAFLRRKRG